MKEKENENCDENIDIITNLTNGYIEDNNLKVFLDDTIDLDEVVRDIKEKDDEAETGELNIDE